jgi:hypothetical protein
MKTGVLGKKGRISLLVLLVLFLLVTPVQATLNVTPEPQSITKTKAWTTLYYLDADYDCDNYDPLNTVFLDEIYSTAQVNVVVIQDREEEPSFLYYIDENHTLVTLEELGEINMGDPQTLSYFITYGKEHYPATHYLLYVYDHGGGWKGACMDTTNGGQITMDGFQTALMETGGVDIIVFFACLMASLETVYELRDCADVVIGSEDLAYFSWWNGVCGETNTLLSTSPELSTAEVSMQLVSFFPEQPNMNLNQLTMSAIRTDKIALLVEALNQLVRYQISHWLRSYCSVRIAHDSTFLLADYQSWAPVFEEYDLKGYIESLPSSPERTAVLDAFSDAVITEVHGRAREETYGLSVFFPAHRSPYALVQLYEEDVYGLDFAADTSWNEFLFFFILTNTLLRK